MSSFVIGDIQCEELARLPFTNRIILVSDIDLYGFCPERDTFYTVVCEMCHAIVKPQALIQHMGMLIRLNFLRTHPWPSINHVFLLLFAYLFRKTNQKKKKKETKNILYLL